MFSFKQFILFVGLLAAVSLVSAQYGPCKHIIVGAGMGGLYAAHELANSTKFPASSICVFEAKNRVGGRIYSVRDDNGHLMFELGGASYDTGYSIIINSIAEAFNLQVACRAHLSSDCDEDGDDWGWVRNVFANVEDAYRKSKTFPYAIRKSESFNKEDDFVDPYDIQDSQALPLADLEEDLEGDNRTASWIAFKTLADWLKNNNVPNTPYTFNNLDLRHGTYDPETGEKYVFSEEYWRMVLEGMGESDSPGWLFHSSKYSNLIYDAFSASNTYRSIFVDSHGNNIGYATFIEKLAQNFTQHGGRIFFNHKITNVKRAPNGKFLFEAVVLDEVTGNVVNTVQFTGHDAILNVGVNDLKAIAGNAFFNVEAPGFSKLIDVHSGVWVAKGFLHYPSNWWSKLLDLTGGSWRTDEPLRYTEFVQQYPDCNVDEFVNDDLDCPSWVMVSYLNGQEYAAYWDIANVNRTEGPIWLSPNDPLTAPYLTEMHTQFMEGLRGLFKKEHINPATIPLPDRGAFSIWQDGWAYTKPNNYPVGSINKAIRQPVPGTPVCIVNTDFSVTQGEGEGSLEAALEALKLCYDLQLPQIPQAYYDNVVNGFY